MQVSEVKVFPVAEEKLKAFVSVVFDGCFMVNDIKIIAGRDGLFISMPSRRKKNGRFKDVAHPLNNETRRIIETEVLAEYERVTGGGEVKARPLGVPPTPDEEGTDELLIVTPNSGEDSEEALAASAAGAESEDGGDRSETTLDDVAEAHLRDSFWTT